MLFLRHDAMRVRYTLATSPPVLLPKNSQFFRPQAIFFHFLFASVIVDFENP